MVKNILFKLSFAILLTITIISCNKPKTELKLNLQKDQGFLMTYQADMKMSQKLMGMSIDMIMNMNMDLEFKTIDIDNDNNFLMKVTYQSMSYKMKAQGQTLELGTDTSINDTKYDNIFQNLKGKSFNMKMNKSGKIIEVKGIDSLMQSLYLNSSLDSSKYKEFKDLFNKNFGEESIKNNFGSFFGIYPEKPVSIGEKWSNKNTVVAFFALTIENNYTLTDNKDNLYLIDIQSVMKTDAKNAGMKISGMDMKFNMKGTQTGLLKIDQKTGWISDSEIKQKINGDALISKPGMPGGGNFAIPYSMESTLKIFIKK